MPRTKPLLIMLCLNLLLLPAHAVQAQEPVSADDTQAPPPVSAVPASDEQSEEQTVATTAPAAPVLQTAAAGWQSSQPAGVCPVISDYLYQQCAQNPADAMCAQPAAAE